MPQAGDPAVLQRIRRIQRITIAWMSVEAAVSLFAAWGAQSPALLAFGGDSAIELISAVVVLWRFRANGAQEHEEHLASRIAGGLLFALAACVVATSTMAISQIPLLRCEFVQRYVGVLPQWHHSLSAIPKRM